MCPPNCWDQLEPMGHGSTGHSQEKMSGISPSTSAHGLKCGSTIHKHWRVCNSSHTHYDIRPPQPTQPSDSQQSDATIKQLLIPGVGKVKHRLRPTFRTPLKTPLKTTFKSAFETSCNTTFENSCKNVVRTTFKTALQPVDWGGQLQSVLDFRDYVLPGGFSCHPNDSKQMARRPRKPEQSYLIRHPIWTQEFPRQSRQLKGTLPSMPGVCLDSIDSHRHPANVTRRSLSIWDTCRVYFMIILLCLSLCLPLSSGFGNTVRICSSSRYTINQCPYGQRLAIVNASYGSDGRACNATSHDIMTCNPRWTRHVVTTLCTGRYACTIQPRIDLQGFNCQVRKGELMLNYTCLSERNFLSLDGRTTAVLSDTDLKSGYLLFAANENAVNNSLIYELSLNLNHTFHVDLSPLAWYPAFAECDNFKMTTFTQNSNTILCGDKSRLNMQIMNSSVNSVVFQFSVNSLKELLLPFLVSSCDLSEITLNSYDDLVINVVGRTLEVSCREGYRRTTSDSTVCKNGVWAGNVSVCEEIICPNLGTIPHGQVKVQGRKWKSVATYSCLRRYTLTGADKRICQTDGTWSGNPPVCHRAFCLPPPVSPPASFYPNDTKDYDVGASVTVTCPVGSDLIGQEILSCLQNSTWSHPSPSCQIVDCGEPDSLNNSVQNYTSTTYQSKVTYTCTSSDEFQSEDRISCGETGMWSSTSLTCPLFLPVESKSMCSGDIVTIKCPEGDKVVVVNASYGLHGNSACNSVSSESTTCSSRWTTQVLTTLCTGKSSCSFRPSTDLQGDHCQVSNAQLDFNFTCVSSDHFVTMENGTSVLSDSISWGCLLPGAKEDSDNSDNSEPDPEPAPPKAKVDLTQVNRSVYLDFAAVNSLPLLENCDSLDLTLRSPSGDITFCKEDIKKLNVIFVDSFVETLDMSWTMSSGNDSRIVVPFLVTECKPKVDVIGGNNLLSVDIGKQRLETICPEGYYKPHKSVCAGGQWLGDDSSCLPVSCPSLGTIPNGQLELTGTTFKHTATYSCLRKFQLVGDSERQCQHTGLWSGKSPICRRIFCRLPKPPVRGWFAPNLTKYFEVEEKVFFRCQKGTTLIGQSEAECLRNNSWSAGTPSCEFVDCGSPKMIPSASLSFVSTIYNSTAHYVCHSNPDFTFAITCAENGRWTSPITKCPITTTTIQTTSLQPTPKSDSSEEEVEDDDDDDVLSLGSILGIIFGAVGLILILSIIGCILCSFTTKQWNRSQHVSLSDIVADNQALDIRDSPTVTSVYVIKNSSELYHERTAPSVAAEHSLPLVEKGNNQYHPTPNQANQTGIYNGRDIRKPPQMGNGIKNKQGQGIPHANQNQSATTVNYVHRNGQHAIGHPPHNHTQNKPNGINNMDRIKKHQIPLNSNNAQLHNLHTTHL